MVIKKDIYNIWNGNSFSFTLNKISRITGLKIPERFKTLADEPISELTQKNFRNNINTKGIKVIIIMPFERSQYEKYIKYINNGVVVISAVTFKDEDGKELPTIKVSGEDIKNIWCTIGRYIKNIINMPTIGITGSVGKTTTTMLMKNIFQEKYKVFTSGGNLNTWDLFTKQMIDRYSPEFDFHIQEVGGGNIGLVEASASVLNADAFCITNILPHHLNNYKNIDGVFYDKVSFDRTSNKDAFAVVNVDDERLKKYAFKSRVVSCGIKEKEAKYVAQNISQNGVYLELEIVYDEKCVPIRVRILGEHNAYNILFSFAMAKEWGIDDETIKNGLLKYKSDPIRQNVEIISGRTFYIDCFNVCEESIKSSLETLDKLRIKDSNKKVAILGGENALGDKAFSRNFEIGLSLRNYSVDDLIFLGIGKTAPMSDRDRYGDAYALYKGAERTLRNSKTKLYYFDDIDDVVDKLVKDTRPGDVILLKGIIHRPFFPIIDKAFGTSFSIYSQYVLGKRLAENEFVVNYYKEIEGSNIIRCLDQEKKHINIPETVCDFPVFRIGKGIFKNNLAIEEVEFGRSVMNIGAESFMGCKQIKHLNIPSNVIRIEKNAFRGCSNLESVIIEGVEHIETGAFSNCINLRYVEFSDNYTYMEDDIFEGSENVCVLAPNNSHIANYAKKKR